MDDPERIWFWYLACQRGCSHWLEDASKQPKVDWTALRCRYDGTPLTSFMPQDVGSEPAP
jgi:hypothetical protein